MISLYFTILPQAIGYQTKLKQQGWKVSLSSKENRHTLKVKLDKENTKKVLFTWFPELKNYVV